MIETPKRQTIINVSNRLPVTIGEGGVKRSSGGLVAALRGVPADRFDLRWLGWAGKAAPGMKREEVARALEKEGGLRAVFLAPEQVSGHYAGFSNSSLWPLLHYMPEKSLYEDGWWEQYRQVNQLFADEVLALVETGNELVWVHDYHLMLLPQMLKAARSSLRVGFFLHTPFPSYEVFRCHPRREELVEGVLGADLVGFHTFGYLRHFRSTAMRLLDLDADVANIRHENGHHTALGVYPIGIDAGRFERELGRPRFRTALADLRQAHAGKHVVLSVERLDYSKGLPRRLDAIERFLRTSGRADEMRFIFIAVPSREEVPEYRRLREEVERRVGHINGQHATISNSPVQFVHQSVSFTELCALYALAEVALVTPMIDGMNLVAKEYVACQREDPGMDPGVLILSEFAGAVEVLFDALVVNPYDVESVCKALVRALELPRAERSRRMRAMRERVMKFDSAWWARSYVDDLVALEAVPARAAAGPRRTDPEALARKLSSAIAAGRSVGLFLDYDGTLREIVKDPSAAGPGAEIRGLLDRLRLHPSLTVTIISGRTPEDLESFLGDYTEFSFIAEHGASLRRAGSTAWEHLDRNINYRWKEEVGRILRLHEASTPGSFVEEKRTSLVWHYRRADPEFGDWKARQLVGELEAVTSNLPLHVRLGRKIVEITAASITKGAAVARLLEENRVDLVVVAGDDTTDESMYLLEVPSLISINVGDRLTQAQQVLSSPAALRNVLEGLVAALPPSPARSAAAKSR